MPGAGSSVGPTDVFVWSGSVSRLGRERPFGSFPSLGRSGQAPLHILFNRDSQRAHGLANNIDGAGDDNDSVGWREFAGAGNRGRNVGARFDFRLSARGGFADFVGSGRARIVSGGDNNAVGERK